MTAAGPHLFSFRVTSLLRTMPALLGTLHGQAAPSLALQRQHYNLHQHATLQRQQRGVRAVQALAQPPAHGDGAQATAPEQSAPAGSQRAVYEPVIRQQVGFPYGTTFQSPQGQEVDCESVVRLLAPMVSEERIKRIEQVAANRTYSVLPIVEGVYDMGNLAAVCRTADALGLGAVHYIDTIAGKYKLSQRTAAGADKWINVRKWDTTVDCIRTVKASGYQVVVTHLTKGSVTMQEVDWTKPTAVILGNEKHGVSEEAVSMADSCAVIPMTGFVESFNISVAAALIMYEAQQQRLRRLGAHADLTQEQRTTLKAIMMMKTIREGTTVLSELLARPAPDWQAGHFKRFIKATQAMQ